MANKPSPTGVWGSYAPAGHVGFDPATAGVPLAPPQYHVRGKHVQATGKHYRTGKYRHALHTGAGLAFLTDCFEDPDAPGYGAICGVIVPRNAVYQTTPCPVGNPAVPIATIIKKAGGKVICV